MAENKKDEEQVYELTDIELEAVSFVRRGANRQPFLVVKSKEGDEMEDKEFEGEVEELDLSDLEPPVTKASITEVVRKAVEGVFKAKAKDKDKEEEPELTEEEKRMLRGVLKRLEGKLPEAAVKALKAIAGKAKDKEEEEYEYGYPKAKKSIEEAEARAAELRKSLDDRDEVVKGLQAKVAEIEKAHRITELRETAKAALGYTAEELYDLEAKLGADSFGKLVEKLKAAAAQAEASPLMKELGQPGPLEAKVQKADDELVHKAEELAEKSNISFLDAVKQVMEQDAELTRRWYEQR